MEKFLIAAVLIASATAGQLKVPSFAYEGERIEMKCNNGFAMSPLKSLTWSKDGKEFYAFKTNSQNPISVTNLDGVTVNVGKSSMYGNTVTIDSVTSASSGLYTCKVEIDHPDFDVAEMSATMKVIPAPQVDENQYGDSYEGYKYKN